MTFAPEGRMVDPRVRGGGHGGTLTIPFSEGRSPRTRGRLRMIGAAMGCYRSIPAYAGEAYPESDRRP